MFQKKCKTTLPFSLILLLWIFLDVVKSMDEIDNATVNKSKSFIYSKVQNPSSLELFDNKINSSKFKEPNVPLNFDNFEGTTEHATTSTNETSDTPVNPIPLPIEKRRLVLLIILSCIIPATFMTLLFWRLHKEKKYLNAAGALVFRETIIVPSYAFTNPSSNTDENGAGANIYNAAQLHAMLYDTPPAYDAAVKSTTASAVCEKGKTDFSNGNEAPPPAYTTIHL